MYNEYDDCSWIAPATYRLAISAEAPRWNQDPANLARVTERARAQADALEAALALSRVVQVEEPEIDEDMGVALVTFTKIYGRPDKLIYRFAAVGAPVPDDNDGFVLGWSVTGKVSLTMIPWEDVLSFVTRDEGIYAQDMMDSITDWSG